MQLERTHDYITIARLNQTVHNLHVELHPDIFKPHDEEGMSSFFERIIQQEQHNFYLAKVKDRVIGYVWIEYKIQPETLFKHASRTLYVHQLSLEAPEQGRGYGKRLMNLLEGIAREKEMTTIELDYWVRNTTAASFYKICGYEIQREFVYKRLK